MYLRHMLGRKRKQVQGLPLVDLRKSGPNYINEGTSVTFTITVFQAVPGMSFEIYSANAGGGDGDWDTPWLTMMQAVCAAHGLTHTTINGQRSKITFTSDYDGLPLVCTRTIKADGTTEETQQADVIMANPIGCYTRGVVSMWIVDTSTTPPGATTIRFTSTGGSNEGDNRTFTIETENIVPGMQIRLYCVNTGSNAADWNDTFATTMAAACAASGCTWTVGAWALDGYITYGSGYSDANPVTFTRTIKADLLTEGTEQCDYIISQVPAGVVVYNGAASVFIVDTSITPQYLNWQVYMSKTQPSPGESFTVRLFVEDGIKAGGITITEGGDATDADFEETMDAAIAAVIGLYPGLSYDSSTNTLTATTSWAGSFQFTRTIKSTSTATKYTLRLSNPTGDSRIKVEDAVCFIGGITPVAYPTFMSGVNISGAEFGSGVVPGTYGSNYFYPTNAMLDWYAAKGFTWFRFPFLWGRLQRTLFGAFDSVEQGRLDAVVDYVTNTLGIHILLDPHNYASYNNGTVSGQIGIGSGKTDPRAFYDFWERLANRYGDNPKVHFGLMNEPTGSISSFEWRAYAQGAVNAIRARTNKTNIITVPGVHWTGAADWLTYNDASFRDFKDPANNFIFEVHQYLDSDSSGTSGVCVVNSGHRLDNFIAWCREWGHKGMVGEIGVSDPAVGGQGQCATEIPQIFNDMIGNQDVFVGYTAWGAGAQWGNYMFRLNPVDNDYVSGVDTGSMDALEPFIVNVA